MRMITAEEVKESAIRSGIGYVPHHECSLCGIMVNYYINGGNLYFDGSCDCEYSPVQPRSWDDAAEWINMQEDDDARVKIMESFGLEGEVSGIILFNGWRRKVE